MKLPWLLLCSELDWAFLFCWAAGQLVCLERAFSCGLPVGRIAGLGERLGGVYNFDQASFLFCNG